MTIIEQAREWLADYERRPIDSTVNKYGKGVDDIAALCRALIERDAALAKLLRAVEEYGSAETLDGTEYERAAAHRALTDDGLPTGEMT